MHQAFRHHFSFGVPVKNQQPIEWQINLKRAKSVKRWIPKMANAAQIRLAGQLEQRQINCFKKAPCKCFSSFIEISLELIGDVCMEQRRFLNGKIHPRFSRMIRSHASRISSDE